MQYLGDSEGAAYLEVAIQNTWEAGLKTRDLGGSASTTEFSHEFLNQLSVFVQ
jgi:isocitrate/isopropylmalate dehydrogenase